MLCNLRSRSIAEGKDAGVMGNTATKLRKEYRLLMAIERVGESERLLMVV